MSSKNGGFVGEQSEDLQLVFTQYFSNQINAHLALPILANDQMTVEQAAKIFPFKGNMKKDFMARTFNYGPHKLRIIENYPPDEVREMSGHSDNKLLFQFKEQLEGALEGLPQPTKHLLDTGIQEKLSSVLFDLKTSELENGEKPYIESKTAYLVQLIRTIVEKMGKENQEGVPEKIVAYGGVETVLNTPLFSSDASFKNKFKTIIGNCKTLNQMKRHGGKDIVEERNKLIESISTCLIKLRFEEKVAQQICNELLQKPLSNIVALRPDLTNKQKESYYNSEFYRSGELKAYAQILRYSESLQCRVKEDVVKIFSQIEQVVKISREIMENMLSFNFYGLFKISTIKHMKKNIYQKVINECPDFLTAFKLIKYQGRKPDSLKENERINQKMSLIDIFFKIKLPFQQWDKAENKILSRDYSVVDDLTLKLEAKHTLLQHIFAKVEPFFHMQEKPLDYKTQVEHALLQLIMDTDLSDLNFDPILNIINETLDGQTGYKSESVGELGKGQIRAYGEVLKKCAQYNEYKSNCGRDIKEEEYQKSWELRKQIYENNLDDRIDVSYQNVEEFIVKVISDGGKIPKVYNKYITDLSKLRGDPIAPIVEQKQDVKPISQQSNIIKNDIPVPPAKPACETPQQLARKFADLAQKFFSKYTVATEDSMLERACVQKFDKNKVTIVKKAIESNAFNDQNSPFFTELAYNGLLTKKIKTQFQKNSSSFAAEISECSCILQRLGSAGGNPPQQPSPPLKKESSGLSKAKAEEFMKKYVGDNEESMLQKAWIDKFGKDSQKLAKELIDLNAFENPESPFFTNLNYNKMLTNRIKKEFERNVGWAVPLLNTMK